MDFYDDLGNLDAASKIQLKVLGEEMDEITKGLETVKTELNASENDGLGSQGFFRVRTCMHASTLISFQTLINYSNHASPDIEGLRN